MGADLNAIIKKQTRERIQGFKVDVTPTKAKATYKVDAVLSAAEAAVKRRRSKDGGTHALENSTTAAL